MKLIQIGLMNTKNSDKAIEYKAVVIRYYVTYRIYFIKWIK